MSKSVDDMGLDAVNAELEKRDAARLRGDAFDRERCKSLMARRAFLIAEDNAGANGLTVEQYEKAKVEHYGGGGLAEGAPFTTTLGKYRKNMMRAVQSARAKAVETNAKAKPARE